MGCSSFRGTTLWSFENLSKMEKEEGFIESTVSSKSDKKISFFHLGSKNTWNNLLDKGTLTLFDVEIPTLS